MFKLHRGRARIDYYPKKASTVIDVGDALMFDDDGKVTTHDGGKKKIIGIAMKNVRSTDSDYASNTKIPVQIGASEDAEFLFETTGLATTDVGQSIGVSTSDPGLASVSGLPTMVVKEYLSATLGSAALIDPIDAFGGDSSQSNNVVTVTIGGNGDYNVESTATDADVQINAAITAVNAVGGGTVQLGAGTFNCAANVSMKGNVILQGLGEASSLVFPINGKRLEARGVDNWKVLNLKIDGSGMTSGFAGGVSSEQAFTIANCQNFEVAGCHIEAYGFGIFTVSTTSSTYTTQECKNGNIHHNYIRGRCGNDLLGGGPNGDSDPDCRDIKLHHNYLEQNDTLGTAGTYRTAFDMVGVKGLIVDSNTCFGNILFGSERDPNETSKIINNTVYPYVGNTSVGAKIALADDSKTQDTSGKCIVAGNYLYGGAIEIRGTTGEHQKKVTVANNIVVNNNAFTSYLQYGIYLIYADECIISNNQCYANGATTNTRGILISDGINNLVEGNFFDGYAVGINGFGTVTGSQFTGNYVINCTATIGSAILTGVGNSSSNNYGINPDCLLYAQGNITGATTFDRLNGDVITGTLTGNITVTLNTTRVPSGSKLTLILTQSSGGHTVTWPSNFKKAGGALALSAGASAVDVICMQYDGTNWREISRSLNES